MNVEARADSPRAYDEIVRELEGCVKDLEEGRLPLERAIERFKEGVELAKLAERRLQEAEGQVSLLLKTEGGGATEEPFASGPDEAPKGPRVETSAPARRVKAGPSGDVPF
ncbi:MAG: exodeoxyribonuclease VII small subunit [Deltaproteobacteria bacterium]